MTQCDFWGHEAVPATARGPLVSNPSVMTNACDKCAAAHLVRSDTSRVDDSRWSRERETVYVGPVKDA